MFLEKLSPTWRGPNPMPNCESNASLFKLIALVFVILQTSLFGETQELNKSVRVADLQFASGQSAGPISFEFVGNHIYLRARVNDSAPLWFLLDTGAAASYLDAQRATTLGLADRANSIKGASLSFPGVRLLNQAFSIQRLGFWAYDGHAVDGMLGYDFISRFVVEIDYANKTVNLHEPKSYKYSGSGEIVPLVMLEDDSGGKVPLVHIKIRQGERATIEGKFIADTGVRSAISFNTPFGETNKLLQFAQKTIQAPLGGGSMVRESKQPVGRVDSVQLGRFKFENPVAIFFQDKTGVIASPEFDGVIGGEILRRFKVIYDYSREQIILEPNSYVSESEEYDMSGMLLVADGADFKVIKVKQTIEGAPASVAGLRDGDIISAVDGEPSSNLTLEQVRQMFKREGRSYTVDVLRGEEKLQTKIKLKRLI